MKKQTMSLAVAAAALLVSGTSVGQMHVNERGLGETLIFPFYTSANGNDTNIHITNTTDQVKAVKVRFLEAMNSQEVLDFNLYLSPEDVWTGTVTANPNGTGAMIRTIDNSCTVPALGSSGGANIGELAGDAVPQPDGSIIRTQPFVNFKYLTDANDTLARTSEGYLEVIEMGQIDPTSDLGLATIHDANGRPADCDALVAAWTSTTAGGITILGEWQFDSQQDFLPTWDGGGHYGYGVLLNVNEGASVGADATAIDSFYDNIVEPNLHTAPGSDLPNLADANLDVAIFDEGDVENYEFSEGADAVSALIMTANISNDYVIDPVVNALTDWVITMPTKRFYVQQTPATAPFVTPWDGATGTACEPVAIDTWDREEAFVPDVPGSDGPVFSPQPPNIIIETDDFVLCTEVNVLGFGATSAVNATDNIFYGFNAQIVADGFIDGWARLSFLAADLNDPSSAAAPARQVESVNGDIFNGLPAIGFAVFNYQNGTLDGGSVLANYASSIEHKTAPDVDSPQ
jgi:hypothetical protein